MNTERWDKLARPPASALKTIGAGRLRGMTDVKPMWRYRVMTEVFGECGEGWKFDIVKLWTEQGSEGQICAFAQVNLYLRHTPDVADLWSEPIPGVGGSLLVAKEKEGLHTSDEAFKMAVTDALSTAMKMIGVAADIHMGQWDGTKYRDEPTTTQTTQPPAPSSQGFSGTNKIGKRFRGTGKPLPAGWFDRAKTNRAAAIEELGGKNFGTEMNPVTGKYEIVAFVDPPQREPGEDASFDWGNDELPPAMR